MRVMVVNDLVTGIVYTEIVRENQKDFEALADFIGEAAIPHYKVEFQDYIPVSSDQAMLEEENKRLRMEIDRQAKALAEKDRMLQARVEEFGQLSEQLIADGKMLDQMAERERDLRDNIRSLEHDNGMLRIALDGKAVADKSKSPNPCDPSRVISVPVTAVPTPPKTIRST